LLGCRYYKKVDSLTVEMALFDDSLVKDLAEKWKVVEKKDHVKTGEYFKKYEQSFIDEVMKHVMAKPEGRSESRKDFMMKNLKYQCMNHAEEIVLPLFSYKMTNFGDNKTKTMNGKGKFKDEETYRDAAIRLGFHKLCQPLPAGEKKEEKKEGEDEEEEEERPAPFHFVYEFTDVRYKIAEKFGKNFTVIKNSDATTASTTTYVITLVSVVVGALVLGETITWNEPVGGVLVVFGAATAQGLISRVRNRRATD